MGLGYGEEAAKELVKEKAPEEVKPADSEAPKADEAPAKEG
jgi:hypothetical protein